MFTVIHILNPLTGGQTSKEYPVEKGKSLAEYMGFIGKSVVSCNEKILELPLDEIIPYEGETYTAVLIPEGVDNKTYRILGFMAIAGMNIFVPGSAALAWKGFYLSGFQKALISGVAGNMINVLLRDKEKDLSQSLSYGWQHKENPSAALGSAMPVIYGKARLRPTLKNRYVTTEGDKQYLYALYSLASHLVDEFDLADVPKYAFERTYSFGQIVRTTDELWAGTSIEEPGKTYRCIGKNGSEYNVPSHTDYWEVWHGTASFAEDIIINGRAIQNFGDDVRWETRPGLAEQTIIDGFEATHTHLLVDTELYRAGIDVEEGNVNLSFYEGLLKVKWGDHYIKFGGVETKIKNGSQDIFPESSKNYYLYYEPSVNTDKYSVVEDTAPTGSGQYIVAKFSVTYIDADFGYIYIPNFISYEGVPASTDYYKPVASLTNLHNIKLNFEFPYGLYGVESTGKIIKAKCRIFAQYRTIDTTTTPATYGDWINFSIPTIKAGSDYPKSYTTGEVARVIDKKTQKPFTISCFAVTPEVDYLDSSLSYEIRTVAASSSIVRLTGVTSIVYGELNAKGDRPGFTYPGEPLLGIKALASGQISGDLDVQIDVERSKVWVYSTRVTPNAWVQVNANNHAWAVYDILVHGFYHTSSDRIHPAYPEPNIEGRTWDVEGEEYITKAEAIYGCGIDPKRIDFESFHDWAENVYDIEYELNIVFDIFMTAWDAILRICQEGRGMVFPVGTKIFAMAYKAQDSVQLFTMGNIHFDTFIQRYMDSGQKANMLEMKYWDADRNYQETLLSVKSADWDESGIMNQPTMLTLYGTTDYTQAASIARFIMESNRLLNNIISFAVDVDALASQVGDVVEVNHDVLNLGTSGRVVSYTTGPPVTVVLDREVTMTGAQYYALKVKHAATGTLEEKQTLTVIGTSSSITFSSAFDEDITEHDEYSFRATGTSTPISSVHTQPAQLYQIIEISRSEELVRTLTLMQYDPAVYGAIVADDSGGEYTGPFINPPDDSVGTVPSILNLASNVRLEEIITEDPTGQLKSSIAVLFDSEPPPSARGSWEIYFRDVDVSDVNWKGVWEDDTPYSTDEKVELNGITFISLKNENTTQPAHIEV